jgi:hypothetical protein
MSSTLERVAWFVVATACVRCGSSFTGDTSETGSGPTGAGGAIADGSVGSGGSSAGASGSVAGGLGGASGSIGGAGGGASGSGPGGSAGAGTGGGITDAGLGGASGGRDAANDALVPASPCPPLPPIPADACANEGLSCTYGTSYRPSCRTFRKCVNLHWIIDSSFGNCPTQGNTCPSDPPANVATPTACNDSQVGFACDYPTGQICSCTNTICVAACMIVSPRYVCSTPPAPPCPAIIPNAGIGCTQALTCSYPGASCGIVAKCSPNTGGTYWTWTASITCRQ